MTTINPDEWLKALSEAGLNDEDDPHAVTLREFADLFTPPLKDTAARRRMWILIEAGKATKTQKRTTDIAGRPTTIAAYRLVP